MDHSSAASSATSGLCESRLCLAGSSAATAASLGTGCSHCPAPWMHPRGLLDPGHSLGATNSCCSGPDSSCGSLQRGQSSALQPPTPLLRSQAVHYAWHKYPKERGWQTLPHAESLLAIHEVIVAFLSMALDSCSPKVLVFPPFK